MKLTKKQKDAMRLVVDGADVSSRVLAQELRSIEKNYPNYICITKVRGKYDGAGHVPYFGAILTDAGRDAL